jgi:hypothetical protein
MMFRRKPKLLLTSDAYARWLRAQRPDFELFFTLPEQEQEELALLGDEHNESFAVLIGRLVADPTLGEAVYEEGQAGAEAVQAARLALSLVAQHVGDPGGSPQTVAAPEPSPTLGGFGERRRAAAAAREAKTASSATFMGMKPTSVRAKNPVKRPDQQEETG